jgi:tetratricopeptide (TPR) repeat protein/TolB-like protein/predicted Ser/Thr protein kinase
MSIKCPKCETENTSDSQFCKKCATPLPFAGDLSITKTLETPAKGLVLGSAFAGRYRIVEELGRGGMGAVYKALDTQINEEVAIKLIRPEIAADEKVLERFSNELKLARKISHKNVCRMFHLEKGEETPYISMEYLEGEDLKSLIRKKEKLSVEEAIGIAQQVCEGLVEAHRLGVVHRDLKPQNIMIGKDGQAKIMDFGIARSVEAPGVTQTGVIIGTPDYISPEQAEGQEADHRSDIYSLGVILYEMVTGSVPFKGDTALSVALKHKAQLPLDPRKRNPEISDDLSRLILICMEKDRARRYQTAKDLLDDLRNIEQGFPLGTKIRPHRATTLSRLIQRKWFIPAAVILGAAVVGLVLWRVLPSRSVPITDPYGRPSIAVLDFQNRTGDPSLDIHAENLSFLFVQALRLSKSLTVVGEDRVFEALSDLNLDDAKRFTTRDLKDIARRAGASHILEGYLMRPGDQLRIVANLRETRRMEVIAQYPVEKPGENPFLAMVDELNPLIKSNLLSEAEMAADEDTPLGTFMSKSEEALNYYREGSKYTISDPQKAVDLLKKAVEADPEFALPYRLLCSTLHDRLNDPKQAREYREKALELIDRFPLRERYHIQLISTNNRAEQIEIARKALEDYPDDTLMRITLGNLYESELQLEEARSQYELLVAARVREEHPYGRLSQIYLALGEYKKAEEVAAIYKNEIAKKDVFDLLLAFAYVVQSKRDLALAELAKIEEMPKNYQFCNVIGDLHLALGDFEEGERYYRHVTEMLPSRKMQQLSLLAYSSALQGRFNNAEVLLREALDIANRDERKNEIFMVNWINGLKEELGYLALMKGNVDKAIEEIEGVEGGDPSGLPLMIHVTARTGQLERARSLADRLKRRADSKEKWVETKKIGNAKREKRDSFLAEGLMALYMSDHAEAIAHFKRAQELLDFPGPMRSWWHPWFFEPLARAYYRSGDLERAQEEYTRLSKMTVGREYAFDIYAKSFYMLGKIAEQRGWPGKAIEHYEKFLEVWKDADPDIPEVEDAKAKLASLKN